MSSNQQYESFLPTYLTMPEKWEEGRVFLTEMMKRVAEIVNTREISYYDNEQILSGKLIYSSTNSQSFGNVFRIVINSGSISIGVNTIAHGIQVNEFFKLFDLFCNATNFTSTSPPTFTAACFYGESEITMDQNNVYITSANAYSYSRTVIEYTLEDF